MRNKIVFTTIASLLVLGGGTASDAIRIDKLPENEKIRVAKEDIIGEKVYTKDAVQYVQYVYTDGIVPAEKDEVVEARTENVKFYESGGKTTARVYVSAQFTKKADVWEQVRYATTTKEAYDLQTKTIIERVMADTFNSPTSDATYRRYTSVGGAYSAAHDGAGIDGNNTDEHLAAQNNKDATYYYIYRNLMPFDTSALPDDATVTSAKLYFRENIQTPVSCADTHYVVVDEYSSLGGTAADYNIANWASTDQSDRLLATSLTLNSWFYFTLNATGIGNISLTGTTQFGIRDSLDMDNTAPTANNNGCGATFPYSGNSAYAPYLDITYTTGGGASSTSTTPFVINGGSWRVDGASLRIQ